jgi:hypothetical protein
MGRFWVQKMILYSVGGPGPISWRHEQKKRKKNLTSPRAKGNSASRLPSNLNCVLGSSLISSLPAHPADFWLAGLRNCRSQFLAINLFRHTYTSTHAHTLLAHFSGEPNSHVYPDCLWFAATTHGAVRNTQTCSLLGPYVNFFGLYIQKLNFWIIR